MLFREKEVKNKRIHKESKVVVPEEGVANKTPKAVTNKCHKQNGKLETIRSYLRKFR